MRNDHLARGQHSEGFVGVILDVYCANGVEYVKNCSEESFTALACCPVHVFHGCDCIGQFLRVGYSHSLCQRRTIMLRILGSRKQLCDGLTRRDLLHVGGMSLLGLGLPDLASSHPPPNPPPAAGEGREGGRAKNVILLFLYGAVSQLDTLDPKPDAPDDIRGPFRTIATRLPGIRLCEHLPRLASQLDRVTLVRSMSHPNPIHGVAYALTGIDRVDIPMELNRHDTRHWPYFGSVLDYLDDQDHPTWPPSRGAAYAASAVGAKHAVVPPSAGRVVRGLLGAAL